MQIYQEYTVAHQKKGRGVGVELDGQKRVNRKNEKKIS